MQLPGRDQRHADTPFRRIAAAVDELAVVLGRYLDKPFALFGHSMGAALAYELSRRVTQEFGRAPSHLFVSAHRAPQLPRRKAPLHALSDRDFIAGVRALNGTPDEVFAHPELVELLLPMLRADFELVETYSESPGPRLSCPVTAMGGNTDVDIPRPDLEQWQSTTSGPFELICFEGGHFYIDSARDSLLRALHRRLIAG